MMAQIYADLVKRGFWTVDQVPSIWRDEVVAILAKEIA